MTDLHKRIEARAFLRRLADARRRYGGRAGAPPSTVDCQPDEPPRPLPAERPVVPHRTRQDTPPTREPRQDS